MQCPTLELLTDFLRDLVMGPERATIQDHLATGCPRCQQNQEWLGEVKRIAPLDNSFEFPEALTARIIAWMPTKMPTKMSAKPAAERTPLRTLIAQLLFDSFAPPPMAEARFAAVMDENVSSSVGRQLLYQVEDYNVDLRIEKNADAYELLGQVLPEDPTSTELAGLSVQLRRAEIAGVTAITDAEGMFRFTDLMPNSYELRIVLGENTIEIPEISVR